ncbi:phosphoglycerate dehydrogenase [Klebsiella sp. BIGb0407]|uniref:phosphoglycerate dehydrogenase n=1 Tax=Klebsiella sp. BIGb0407 TaxID=2940603 RepID=UPI00216A6F51|nr:phosphoglycerate dehydrogenase [Klebsiella sp. BIGb0407]MCS3430624.1 D-3-phosphoglycerate dehydrogenase [Klebsiella sp. BIGb0407]
MKVISTSPSFAKYDNAPIAELEKNGFEFLSFPADISLEELKPHLSDTVALIVAFTDINDEFLSYAPDLRIVCKHGVGVDNINLEATKKRNIWVTNVPNANKHAVADFTFSLLLSAARQVPQAYEKTKQGLWPRIFATDVYKKTIGILGLGNIGKEVALRAKGFNMDILAYDPYPDVNFAKQHNVQLVALDELISRSDFITIHMPLTKDTDNLFNITTLSKMKKSAFILNLSRGGIVNEGDLYTVLSTGLIAGGASDVFVEEPLTQHPLFTLDNFIGTSHIAGYTEGAVQAIGEQCVENIINLLVHNKKPIYVMNNMDAMKV